MWYEAGDERFVHYLLGGLTAPERDRFEDEYFANDAVHEQLLAIECEVIDAYLRGDLSVGERQDFESQYLTTAGGRAMVERARLLGAFTRVPVLIAPLFDSLAGYGPVNDVPLAALIPPASQRPGEFPDDIKRPEMMRRASWWRNVIGFFRLQPAAMRLVLVSAGVILIFLPFALKLLTRKPGNRTATTASSVPPSPPRSQPERAKPMPELPSPLQRPESQKAPPPAAALLSFVLAPIARGQGDGNLVQLPLGDHRINLQILIDGDAYPAYRATLQTPEGRDILSKDTLRVGTVSDGRKVVELPCTSDQLRPGDYIVRLSGIGEDGHAEAAGGYSFQVVSLPKQLRVGATKEPVTTGEITPPLLTLDTVGSPPEGNVGERYEFRIVASGGVRPYQWSLVSKAPPGLSMKDGTLGGVPTADGPYIVQVRVTDQAGKMAERLLAIAFRRKDTPVTPSVPLQILTSSLPEGKVKHSYTAFLKASGGKPAYQWSVARGQLPLGLQLDSSSGAIRGTPSAETRSNLTIRLADAAGQSKDITLALVVLPEAKAAQTPLCPSAGLVSEGEYGGKPSGSLEWKGTAGVPAVVIVSNAVTKGGGRVSPDSPPLQGGPLIITAHDAKVIEPPSKQNGWRCIAFQPTADSVRIDWKVDWTLNQH